MSKFEDGCYGSLKGIALIAKVLAGRCQMHYTRVAVGKGAIPDDLTPKTLTVPPDYVMDAIISAVTNPVDGECQVSVQINSAYVEAGFYATWLILYAEDPDEGEVPFTALCLENEPEWIRPASSIVGKLAHFDIIAAVGDVDTVTATIDPHSIVTRAEVEQLIAAATVVTELSIPVEGWERTGAGRYPFVLDIPVEGCTEKMIPRLTVLEEGEDTAIACGLAPRVQTLDGVIRVSAVSVPKAPIPCSLTLQGGAFGLIPSGGNGGIGVKVRPGSGLKLDSDGYLMLDTATQQEVAELFKGSENSDGSNG